MGEGLSLGEIAAVVAIKDMFTDVLIKAKAAIASLGPVGETVVKVIGGIAVAAGAAAATLIALGSRGAEVADVSDAFKSLTSSLGGSTASLAALRAGTLGTISDFNLMKIANETLGAGVRLSADDFGVMARAAQIAADATGGDMVQSLQTMSDALVSGRTRAVEFMGITIQQDAVITAYAKAHGVAADAISDLGKKEAIRAALLDAMRAKVAAAGAAELDFGDKLARVKTWVQNATDALAVAIAQSPVINTAMDVIGDAMERAFGDNQQQTIKALIGYVNQLAIALVGVASAALTTADLIYRTWSGLKAVFLLTASALGLVVSTLAFAVTGLLAAASKIPIIGQDFKAAADATAAWAETTLASAKALANQAVEAGKAAASASTVSTTIDGWKKSLDDLTIKMQAASTQTGTHVEKVKALGMATQGAVIDTDKLKEAADKLRAAMAPVELKQMSDAIDEVAQSLDFAEQDIQKQVELAEAIAEIERHSFAAAFGMRGFLDAIHTVGTEVDVVVPKLTGLALVTDNIAKGLGPAVLAAFQGGGSATKAIGGFLGGEIGKVAGPALAKAIGGTLGSVIGSFIPGLGTLLGGLAGSFLGRLFSDPEKEINPVRRAFVSAAGGLGELNRRAVEAGVTLTALLDARNPEQYKDAIEDLNRAFAFQNAAMVTLDETLKKYHFTLDQMSPAQQARQITMDAAALFKDLEVLLASGMTQAQVLMNANVRKAIQELVLEAMKTGQALPEQFRPWIEAMRAAGQLVDANGKKLDDLSGLKFGDTLVDQFRAVLKAVLDLTDAIRRGLSDSIRNIPTYTPGSPRSRKPEPPTVPTLFGGDRSASIFGGSSFASTRSGPAASGSASSGDVGGSTVIHYHVAIDSRGAWFDDAGVEHLSSRIAEGLSKRGPGYTRFRGALGVDR